ncbi:putative arabinase [Violaceomyces palustris]|uniref:Arabinase n=1 Tax=Violaceomyces palustris TaxID=1673888 RepID=A0ACD0NSV3_9BASI|nr:putative arabinase [Violaceomyces palustris]
MRPFSIVAFLAALGSAFLPCASAAPLSQSGESHAIELAERESQYAGYAFFYFVGDNAGQEKVFAAVSKANSPLTWDLVNGGNAFLTSSVGTGGARDPSVVRSGDGRKYFMLATDLQISKAGWAAAQRKGSRNMVVWETSDITNWGAPRLVEVIDSTAGNVWAPEAMWNEATKSYDVVFSAAIFDKSDTTHAGPFYQRVMKCSTVDFKTFTKPASYVDDGKNEFIDTTFLRGEDSHLYRFTKDENEPSLSNPNGKMVFEDVSSNGVDGPWRRLANSIGKNSIKVGEGPTAFADNVVAGKYWLFIDEFGGRGYIPFSTSDIRSGIWSPASGYSEPSNKARHGTVLPVTLSEWKALRALI